MKSLLLSVAVFAGQINMNTLQRRPVVHLRPYQDVIGSEFGADLLELSNTPAVISLPIVPPRLDSQGNPWSIDVKNLGPREVTVVGKNLLSVPLHVGRTVRIYSSGTAYSLKPVEAGIPPAERAEVFSLLMTAMRRQADWSSPPPELNGTMVLAKLDPAIGKELRGILEDKLGVKPPPYVVSLLRQLEPKAS